MSRIHIRFTKEQEAGDVISYRVDSPDFSEAKVWEPIAQITINRGTASYTFEPLGKFVNVQIVPPFVFEIAEEDRAKLLNTQYAGYVYSGWTARIASVTRRLLATSEFPDEAYGIT